MKVSVVVTVYKETRTIKALIDSLLAQSKKADEIIIVNAGKTKIKKSSPLRIIELKGSNRSQARNKGIKSAKNEIIAITDAGCVADKNWLKNLTAPFKDKRVKSVAGYYHPVPNTFWQKSIAPFVAVMPDKFDRKTFLPSSRSVAFRKGIAWYPEELNYCEDLVFVRSLKEEGKMAVIPQAIVNWSMKETWWEFFDQIYNYARGDVQARYQPHVKKIWSVWLRYLLFFLIKPLFSLYFFWPIYKHYRYVQDPLGWVYLPVAQITADVAVMAGSLSAIISPDDTSI